MLRISMLCRQNEKNFKHNFKSVVKIGVYTLHFEFKNIFNSRQHSSLQKAQDHQPKSHLKFDF